MTFTAVSIFIGIAVFMIAIQFFDSEKETESSLKSRLERLKSQQPYEGNQEIIDTRSLMMYSSDFRFKVFSAYLRRFRLLEYIRDMLYEADSKLQIDTFVFFSILCVLPLFIVIIFTSPWLFPVSLIGLIIPTIFMKTRIETRLRNFTQQFPDALSLLSSSLRAGHSLIASFEVITSEMPTPVSQVFKSAVDDISLGIDTKDAVNSMQKVVPQSIDLRFFTTAILIQREAGGNLTEILDTLSLTIRERFKLMGQLKAQTAQTRFSGVILCIAPPAIAAILFVVSPDYMKPLLETDMGHLALLVALFLLILGIYTIKRITNIDF